ncbi:hypothetical protein ACVR1G_08230 [Streptococcus dentasini]
MEAEELRAMAKEIAENINFDGMIFYVLENGDYGVTQQGSAYWPVRKVWEIGLDKWIWRESLDEAGITEDGINDVSDTLIDYIEDDLQWANLESLIEQN